METTKQITNEVPEGEKAQTDVNQVLIVGTLSRDSTTRELASGDTITSFDVYTRTQEGRSEVVPVVVFNHFTEKDKYNRFGQFETGTRVEIKGSVRKRFFQADGNLATRTEVEATSLEIIAEDSPIYKTQVVK